MIAWEQGRVRLIDIVTGDPDMKIADAVKNTRNAELLVSYGAVNRQLANSGWSSTYDPEEIDALSKQRLYISTELARRLERWEYLEALQTMENNRERRRAGASAAE